MKTATKNLQKLIEDVWREGEYVNPYDTLDAVMAQIDPEDYEEFLRKALRPMILSITGNLRRRLFHKSIKGEKPYQGPRVQVEIDPVTLEEKRVPHPAYSFKRDLARSAWQEFLDQSIVREDGTYVRLAIATVSDLQYAAQMRREQADALNNEAEKYTALAEKMLAKGVSSLDGLTAEDVRGIV